MTVSQSVLTCSPSYGSWPYFSCCFLWTPLLANLRVCPFPKAPYWPDVLHNSLHRHTCLYSHKYVLTLLNNIFPKQFFCNGEAMNECEAIGCYFFAVSYLLEFWFKMSIVECDCRLTTLFVNHTRFTHVLVLGVRSFKIMTLRTCL